MTAALPKDNDSLLVRTDFSDEDAWARALRAARQENEDGFRAYFARVDDPAFAGADWRAVKAAVPDGNGASVLFIADRDALASPEHPFLVVDLDEDREPFRCVAAELWAVENNLNISNMDWEDYADHVDEHGVYRG
ncbi:MAG: hypothetical protein FWE35_07345 [Streptosporangiales bacterium]|jgi:hypothetical protein|nr:hypothetical protein [Streptosporangiales bacterium]